MERITPERVYRAEMANVMINCPKTGKPISTGIGMDAEAFKTSNMESNTIGGCPECGGPHTWNKSDAFLDS